MKRILALGALLGALALGATPAQAQEGKHRWRDVGTVLNAVACNASAGTRTWTATSGSGAGFGLAAFQFDFTYNAATAVTWTCFGSLDGGTTYAELQSCSVSSGTCTSTDAVWSKAVSASDDWIWRVDFLGLSDIKCTLACTGGGASDTTIVYGRFSDQ